MISYILESSICLASFYSIYWLFLRKEKLLSINRFYLLTTALLSILIPILNIGIQPALVDRFEALATGVATKPQLATEAIAQTPALSGLQLVYVLGLSVSIGFLIIKVLLVKKRVPHGLSPKGNRVEVIESDQPEAFSFLNTIFISKSLHEDSHLKQQILAHEKAHIKGKHSLDIMFFELIKCLYWFHPFSYFYARSIRLQHEYIADQSALAHTDAKTYEHSLLRLTLSQVNKGLVSAFNEHPVEKRLKMIQKLNSNIMNKFKTLFALPVFVILFIAFACTEEASPENAFEELEIPLDQNSNALRSSESSEGIEVIVDSISVVEGKENIFTYKLRIQEEGEIPLSEGEGNEFTLMELKVVEGSEANFKLKDKSGNEFTELPVKKH